MIVQITDLVVQNFTFAIFTLQNINLHAQIHLCFTTMRGIWNGGLLLLFGN